MKTPTLRKLMVAKRLIGIFIFVNCTVWCAAQSVIKGNVTDVKSGETLIGATVVIKGTTEGAATDVNGNFSFTTSQNLPITLVTSFVGYINIETVVTDIGKEIKIKIGQNEVVLKDVTITGSRISEKIKENPLTIEALDYIAIKETPAASFYEGLGQLKGVDLTSASIGFKVINTRGFNSTSPVRSLQIIDGVDNASPGLNFSLGNFLGCSELDVNKVDLVVGASSAYYGPNAFNGVISMTTRDPFLNPGFEMSYKIGERNLNETAWRLAHVIKNKKGEDKFAYKLNFCFLKVDDWEAENYSATEQSRADEKNPGGFDAVNIYGDEYSYSAADDPLQRPGLNLVFRRGYRERDIVDYNTENLKLGASAHYKITPKTEVIYSSSYGNGTTIYQGDNRYSLKDIQFYQNRLELRQKDKWFIRGYYTNEDAGKSYDAFFTALLLQRATKDDNNWTKDYDRFWNDSVKSHLVPLYNNAIQPQDFPTYTDYINAVYPYLYNNYYDTLVYFHQQATEYLNNGGYFLSPQYNPFLEPGTPQFDSALASITSKKTFKEGGSRFYDKSALYHIHGEYKFTPAFCDITLGGNYRKYLPKSEGTIFSDTASKITNEEFGAYAGFEKKLLKEKLRINASARLDKNENFPYVFSPAVGAVYNINKEHIVRGSFSSAIRNPTLADQYLYYQVGRAILIGNTNGYEGLVTVPSLLNYIESEKNFDTLEFFSVKAVRPEKVKTVELGYRATIGTHLYIDIGGYYSWYKDFIGYKIGADVDTFTVSLPFQIPYKDLYPNNILRVATNSEDEVTTHGASVGLNYYIGKYFAANANYSWNVLDRHGSDDPLIPAFNTPEHKYNVGFSIRNWRNLGFNINYKWVQGFNYEGSPQFTGYIPDYDMIDVQANYRFEERLTFKLGASNVLNNKHYEVYGGPLVGRLIYFSILLELKDAFKN